jgi:hypothetical protein
MPYKAAIASFCRDETTLAKSFIISLKNAAANWYARLPPRSITSWAQLKENFLVNFQGFQADINTEEGSFSCQQYERETLQDFFYRFLRLKAQASEVSEEPVTPEEIKPRSARTNTEAIHSPSEAQSNDLLEPEHMKAVKNL